MEPEAGGEARDDQVGGGGEDALGAPDVELPVLVGNNGLGDGGLPLGAGGGG